VRRGFCLPRVGIGSTSATCCKAFPALPATCASPPSPSEICGAELVLTTQPSRGSAFRSRGVSATSGWPPCCSCCMRPAHSNGATCLCVSVLAAYFWLYKEEPVPKSLSEQISAIVTKKKPCPCKGNALLPLGGDGSAAPCQCSQAHSQPLLQGRVQGSRTTGKSCIAHRAFL